ncbi:MAG: MotA/TolQ/ExbB proton channel family protein [Lachnospiraceae bacterium]|nr:MotA/TolQ/ExbB proton channel family protein [Lachnospiraceae bacterium]
MLRKRGYEFLLLITYVAMAAVCVYLQFFTKAQAGNITNLIVNIAMFVIVAVILFFSVAGSLLPTSHVTADLIRVTEKIENDARNSHRFLWEKYAEEKEELFKNRILIRQYQDYQYELERIVHTDKTYYKCDIEDYIGFDLIDSTIHRDRLNQVAGVMTGLGILGTFIGLSLGLQSFNTGTTAEITNSIAPLMGGIKVAFHTSIYGMVFSLVFNYIYKRRLDDAESAVRAFLSAYRKYVLPDTTTDGVNRLMELQQQQTEAIISMSDTVAHQLSEGLKELLEPQFDRFDETIQNFANVATKNQAEQLGRIVDVFISEMNRSLGNAFTSLSATVNDTLVIQEENRKQIQTIFEKNLSTAENVSSMSEQTESVANALRLYSDKVLSMEKQTNDTLDLLRRQNEASQSILNGATHYMSDLENYKRSIDIFSAAYDERLKAQEARLRDLQKLTEAVPLEVNETFNIINENLQKVENHFKDTIEHINSTMDRVPEVVDYSYRGIEQGLNQVAASLERLREVIETTESYYRRRQ